MRSGHNTLWMLQYMQYVILHYSCRSSPSWFVTQALTAGWPCTRRPVDLFLFLRWCCERKLCVHNTSVEVKTSLLLFDTFFIKNCYLYAHDTKTCNHRYVPIVKSDLGNTGIRYRAVFVWNKVLKAGSNMMFQRQCLKKWMKSVINVKMIWSWF